jgi:multiple sugar transport system permease protein
MTAASLVSRLPGRSSRELRSGMSDERFGFLCVVPTVVILVTVVAAPIVTVFVMSVQQRSLYLPPSAQGAWAGLKNYTNALSDPEFAHSLRRLGVYVGGSVLGQFLIGFALALALNVVVRGRALLRGLLLLPWILPSAATTLLWLFIFNPQFGVLNYVLGGVGLAHRNEVWLGDFGRAMPSLIGTNIWRGYPFHMLVLLAALQAVPAELLEAARVDGATAIQRFRYVVLPSIRFVIALDLIIATIWQTQNIVSIDVLTQGGPGQQTEVTTHYIYRYAFEKFDYGIAAAMSVMLMMILIGASLIILRVVGKREARA